MIQINLLPGGNRMKQRVRSPLESRSSGAWRRVFRDAHTTPLEVVIALIIMATVAMIAIPKVVENNKHGFSWVEQCKQRGGEVFRDRHNKRRCLKVEGEVYVP